MQDEHPVAYASRDLTPTETDYAQMENELLSLELSDLRAMSMAERSLLTLITNFSRFVRFVLIRSNRVESTTFLTHPTLSRGTIFSNSRANRLPVCRIDSRGND